MRERTLATFIAGGIVVDADTHPSRVAAILEVADKLLLLRVNRDRRLARCQRFTRLCVDIAELRVTVGMVAAFPRLAIGLQAVAEFAQQAGHRIVPDPVAQAPRGSSQVALALAGPQQWRLWITACRRLYQLAQIIEQRGIAGREFLPPAAKLDEPDPARLPSPRPAIQPDLARSCCVPSR